MSEFLSKAGEYAVEYETDGDNITVRAVFPDGGDLDCTASTTQILELQKIVEGLQE